MENERSHPTERILNLTLEIIHILTGENYIAFKLSDGLVTSNLKTQIPVIEPQSHSLSKDKKRIREFTREIIELLAGEVPERCPDGALHFSMEEWEYLEGQKDLYKDVKMENRPSLTSPDGSRNRNTPERCPRPLYSRDSTQEYQEIPQARPLYSRDSTQEHQEIPQARPLYSRDSIQDHQEIPQEQEEVPQEHQKVPQKDQDENNNLSGTETRDDPEESPVRDDEPCKEEKTPPEISTEPGDTQRDVEYEKDVNLVKIKEEDLPPEIGTSGQYLENNTKDHLVIYPDCEIEDEEDITLHPTKGNPMTPNRHPAPYSADLQSGPSTHMGWLSDDYYPVAHHEDHGSPYSISCPVCGKCFSERSKLATHRRSHCGDKPYTCMECGKSFKQSGHLVSHHRTHTRVHPYSCSECGKCFSQKSNLIRHEKVHTGEKSFSCLECGKRFSEKCNLIRHEKIHTGEKPYSCSECGRRFSLRANLIAHVRIHTGEKPFACFQCGKCFSRKSVLNIHERVHTGEKPYSCADCGKCFSKRFLLARHAKLHTGEKSISCPAMDSLPTEPISSFTRGLTEVLNKFCYQTVDSFHMSAPLSQVPLPAGDRRFLYHNVAGE